MVDVEFGDLLFVEGQSSYDFIVIVEGAVAIVRRNIDRSDGEDRVTDLDVCGSGARADADGRS